MMKPFFLEMKKYAEGIHILNPGASEALLDQLEAELNIKLPKVYREFLKICNGGELFAIPAGTILSEVYDPMKGEKKEGESYLNDSFKPERRWPGMPSTYLIIAHTNYGDMICMDLASNNGQDAKIVQWSHETGRMTTRWNKLIKWLMDEMESGAMLIDYEGKEKEL